MSCVPYGLLFLEFQEYRWRPLRARRDSLKAQTPPERTMHSNHIEYRLHHTAEFYIAPQLRAQYKYKYSTSVLVHYYQ